MCSVHVMPIAFQNSLNKALLSFLVPFSSKNMTNTEIFNKITKFAAPKHLGGYGVDHISIHADLFLLKSVMRYMKCKVENVTLSNDLFFVEYNLGVQLARMFGFHINNRTPHAYQPSTVYSYVMEIIQVYKITRDELVLGSVNKIYKRIIFSLNESNSKFKYNRILCNALPSYLQSFNFRLYNDLLPVNTKFRHYALDNDSCCYFCCEGPESIFQINQGYLYD